MSCGITKMVFSVELGPLQRHAGTVYLHDADLDDQQTLVLSDRVELRDEAGYLYAATVEAIDPGPLG